MVKTEKQDENIAKMVDHELTFARSVILEGGEYQPQLTYLAREKDGLALFPVAGLGAFFETDEQKRTIRKTVKALWYKIMSQHPGIELIAILFTSDTWVETPGEEELQRLLAHGRDKPFEPKPGMAESIVVMLYTAVGEWQYHWPYVRGERSIVFADKPDGEVSVQTPRSFLSGLWPL